jgi:carbon monoxide dehydrogenase subunit G
MKLMNEFVIDASLERAWPVLLDLERVARCLPGVVMTPGGLDGVHHGEMKLKLGPMVMHYAGSARLGAVDPAAHTAAIEVEARERKGQGSVSALITNRLEASGDRTRVVAETDLAVTGRAAQFGRGIMQDVAERMLGEFADRFEEELRLEGAGDQGAFPTADGAATARPDTVGAFDVGRLVGGPLARRARVGVAAVGLATLVAIVLRRRRARTR